MLESGYDQSANIPHSHTPHFSGLRFFTLLRRVVTIIVALDIFDTRSGGILEDTSGPAW